MPNFINLLKSGVARYITTDEPAFVMVGDSEQFVLVYENEIVYNGEDKTAIGTWTNKNKT